MSTQCRFCGEAVRPDSMFCPACGQLVGAAAGALPPPFPTRAADAAPAVVAAVPAAVLAPVPLPAAPVSADRRPAAASVPEVLALVLPDGHRIPIDQTLVLGRSPEAGAAEYGGLGVRIDDPGRSMSRIHLIVAPEADGFRASDPGSANGTVLIRGGERLALSPGAPAILRRGDVLELGDQVVRLD